MKEMLVLAGMLGPGLIFGASFPRILRHIGVKEMSQSLRHPQQVLMLLILIPWLALISLSSALLYYHYLLDEPAELDLMLIVGIMGAEIAIISIVAGLVGIQYVLPWLRKALNVAAELLARVTATA